ncbi:site-specific integrase [Nocardia cyriacigeorgica]|uniref:site-specific integrase n=1 Tax=Nocardia cyriacigeorgica TaxID=135487 RepID=UPI001895EC75|nr:site-specific integrase [Nocardia cyriacigeorgica]MBF6439643.1 site-specific integrase [Nocardia cyriacigeorgica]
MLGPDGFPDARVNAFLASPTMRTLAETTNRDYAQCLALWLNFLEVHGRRWWEATEDDAEEFEFWRLTDPSNESTAGTSTLSKDIAACKKFYSWASRRYADVVDVFADVEFPAAKREAAVKWLDPAALQRWRDLGLRGRDVSGRRDRMWRGRNEQRDVAFVDGLYGTGLRLSEWASVVLPEVPALGSGRSFYTCELADACAKGGYGHSYWIPRKPLSAVWAYVEGARARVVRQAQADGRYEEIRGLRVVDSDRSRSSVVMPDGTGGTVARSWDLVRPGLRCKLFRQTSAGLEPLWLWLNEDGMPRDPHGWHHTFDAANRRIAALGLANFTATAHMVRHSCALKWFSIGKLIYAKQLGHLDADELSDFREQFGDTWSLVATMLGHRRVETTKSVYLAPFRNLAVEVLLAHAEDFPVEKFMAQAFAGHPQVITDPLRRTR